MSDNIPFEIQSEIMKWLPVKSLLRFRSVSKSCKSLIDSPDFIKHYIGQQQHLFVRCYKFKPMSIVDDDSLPTQTASVTLPSLVEYPNLIGTSHGLFCFYGPSSRRAVIFNPCIRKTLAFAVPRVTHDHLYRIVIGFGVCRHTADPKFVKISLFIRYSDIKSASRIPWQVEVFILSTSTWRSAYSTNLPRNSISIYMNQVAVDGCLYWLARDGLVDGCPFLIVSFDLTSEEFREVNLPDSLAQFRLIGFLSLYKLRESLAVVKDGVEANKRVYHVWMMQDDSFVKLYTINSSHSPDVSILHFCGFRKTGQPLIELSEAHPGSTSRLTAYDPYSKSITNIPINGNYSSYTVYSYMETLLLL